jgi:hypothetical protein
MRTIAAGHDIPKFRKVQPNDVPFGSHDAPDSPGRVLWLKSLMKAGTAEQCRKGLFEGDEAGGGGKLIPFSFSPR